MVRGTHKRNLHHFNFTGWPKNGVPSSTATFMAMLDEIGRVESRVRDGKHQHPLLVHDINGTGRAGTFIGIHNGIKQIQHSAVNVADIVAQMREDRGGLVQHTDEYIFIHKV